MQIRVSPQFVKGVITSLCVPQSWSLEERAATRRARGEEHMLEEEEVEEHMLEDNILGGRGGP